MPTFLSLNFSKRIFRNTPQMHYYIRSIYLNIVHCLLHEEYSFSNVFLVKRGSVVKQLPYSSDTTSAVSGSFHN